MAQFDLTKFADPTGIAVPGMTVRELFEECSKARVAGLPFRDASGKIAGKASIRNILKEVCLPDFMVENANVLGDTLDTLRFPEIEERRLLETRIDDFIFPDFAQITPASPLSKALARMEAHDTTYCFVIDANQKYYGVLSIVHVAMRILERNQ